MGASPVDVELETRPDDQDLNLWDRIARCWTDFHQARGNTESWIDRNSAPWGSQKSRQFHQGFSRSQDLDVTPAGFGVVLGVARDENPRFDRSSHLQEFRVRRFGSPQPLQGGTAR